MFEVGPQNIAGEVTAGFRSQSSRLIFLAPGEHLDQRPRFTDKHTQPSSEWALMHVLRAYVQRFLFPWLTLPDLTLGARNASEIPMIARYRQRGLKETEA